MENLLGSIFLISGRPTEAFTGLPHSVMYAFFVIAIGLFVVGVITSQRRKSWLQQSQLTQGKIVEISKRYERSDKRGQSPIFFPIVSFNVNGRQFKIESDRGMNKLEEGDTMTVRYNPENPYESALGDNNIPGTKPNLFFVLGVLLFAVSIFLTLHTQTLIASK
jgi:uncharacterized membrane protein YtjA (UPF0391 family)